MEKTADSVAAEIAALKHSLTEVTAAVNEYAELAVQNVGNKDVMASGSVKQSHKDLFLKTNKLLRTVRGPVDMVTAHLENVSTQLPILTRIRILPSIYRQFIPGVCEQ